MIDLTQIDDDTLMARGSYATVRGQHEDEKQNLSVLCGELSSTATKILRQMQPAHDDVPASVDELIASGRKTLDAMDLCAKRIVSLAQQRAALKHPAWGRK